MRRELVCFSFRVKPRQTNKNIRSVDASIDDEPIEIRCSIAICSVSACAEPVPVPAEIVIFHLIRERQTCENRMTIVSYSWLVHPFEFEQLRSDELENLLGTALIRWHTARYTGNHTELSDKGIEILFGASIGQLIQARRFRSEVILQVEQFECRWFTIAKDRRIDRRLQRRHGNFELRLD